MKASTRAWVRSRAAQRCEYYRLHESDLPWFPFHVEHIVARKHGGTDDPWNGPRLEGRTASGRATIAVLNINVPHRVDLRDLLIRAGSFPPA